ncbi:MAG: adenylosuccinate lyase [Nanoarchaeota archaeon]|nr:adenylosuccinate lyase [Nanoarchaeota archaeon]MBU0977952.1 adenylosuccinate lyase [Nanoarchaeota archaeon]
MVAQDPRDIYQSPLVSRYTSWAMQHVFSDNNKFGLWRRVWLALAEAQHEKGLARVTGEMVEEMRAAIDELIDWDFVAAREKEIRHDVMAHADEFRRHLPTAKGIVHLGATSMDIGDNTELIQHRQALGLIKPRLIATIANLARFAEEHKGLVTLAYTHYQPAQPTTVGKRTTLYIQDLLFTLDDIERVEGLVSTARGLKGATGTQASFLELFDGDEEKVRQLDDLFSRKLGFDETMPVTGQTYSRAIDYRVAAALGGLGGAAHKFAVDLRLLSNLKVMEEPFEKDQTGSSAMPYKRNPMRAERMTGLSRELMSLPGKLAAVHGEQWLERTLDDSAQKRIVVAEGYLTADAVLNLYQNISKGMVVYPAQIEGHLRNELPFMAVEEMLMEACKKGADRQVVHELLKGHSVEAGRQVKEHGRPNDLLDRVAGDSRIGLDGAYLDGLISRPGRFAGMAASQTERFLADYVAPVLSRYGGMASRVDGEIKV